MCDLFLQVKVLLIGNVRILVSSLQIIQLVTKAVDCEAVSRTASNIIRVGFFFYDKKNVYSLIFLFLIGRLQ